MWESPQFQKKEKRFRFDENVLNICSGGLFPASWAATAAVGAA
jgi:hypothetical protein